MCSQFDKDNQNFSFTTGVAHDCTVVYNNIGQHTSGLYICFAAQFGGLDRQPRPSIWPGEAVVPLKLLWLYSMHSPNRLMHSHPPTTHWLPYPILLYLPFLHNNNNNKIKIASNVWFLLANILLLPRLDPQRYILKQEWSDFVAYSPP